MRLSARSRPIRFARDTTVCELPCCRCSRTDVTISARAIIQSYRARVVRTLLLLLSANQTEQSYTLADLCQSAEDSVSQPVRPSSERLSCVPAQLSRLIGESVRNDRINLVERERVLSQDSYRECSPLSSIRGPVGARHQTHTQHTAPRSSRAAASSEHICGELRAARPLSETAIDRLVASVSGCR